MRAAPHASRDKAQTVREAFALYYEATEQMNEAITKEPYRHGEFDVRSGKAPVVGARIRTC